MKLMPQYNISIWDALGDKLVFTKGAASTEIPFGGRLLANRPSQNPRVLIRLVMPLPNPHCEALAGRLPLICSMAAIIGPLRSQRDIHHVAEPLAFLVKIPFVIS